MLKNSRLAELALLGILGFSSGLPFMVTGMTMSSRLTDAGFSLQSLGLFTLVSAPYSFKVLFAPSISVVKLPFFGEKMGNLRAWAILSQCFLIVAYVLLSITQPLSNILFFAVLCIAVAFFSAIQDVALDGYRISWLSPEKQAMGAGFFVNFYRLAMMTAGAGAIMLSDIIGWQYVMISLAFLQSMGVIAVLLLPFLEYKQNVTRKTWIIDAIMKPLKQLLRRPRWLGFLLLILVFRLPDAYLGSMNYRFLYDTGFSKVQIATAVQVYGLVAVFFGGIFGGLLLQNKGLYAAMLIAAVVQMVSNLGYLWIHAPIISHLILVVTVEELSGGIATAIFLGFLAILCDRSFATTQYAILTSMMALTRVLVASTSGSVAFHLGWQNFFLLSFVMGGISLGIVIFMKKFLQTLTNN